MTTRFDRLGLPEPIVDALARIDITEAFPIQASSIPDALAGRDVCGKAPTGSGKTLAFGLPLLTNVDSAAPSRPRGLVLAPTRELAQQIVGELAPFASAMSRRITAIYGGVGYGPQTKALRRGVDVVVATPGRLEDLIQQRILDLSDVDVVVLDEADRMADMGFLPAVRRIVDATSSDRQTLLFSATLDGDIAALSARYQRDPARHESDAPEDDGEPASHHFWLVDHHDRVAHTAEVIQAHGTSIVFTRTRRGADRLAKKLTAAGVSAAAIHGGRSQSQRDRALRAFASGKVAALIGTDVAARGIHVDDVAAVVHYDPPGDSKDYVHRSGRTARAGAGGVVVTLVTREQRREVTKMQRELGRQIELVSPAERPVLESVPAKPREATHGRTEQSEGSTRSVYVANLPWATTDEDLGVLFGRFGAVHNSTVITDRKSGRSRGFGFVDMAHDHAERAIRELHGADFEGRDLTVRSARPSGRHS